MTYFQLEPTHKCIYRQNKVLSIFRNRSLIYHDLSQFICCFNFYHQKQFLSFNEAPRFSKSLISTWYLLVVCNTLSIGSTNSWCQSRTWNRRSHSAAILHITEWIVIFVFNLIYRADNSKLSKQITAQSNSVCYSLKRNSPLCSKLL